ncbi:MAG TPA: hypothetical protein VFJ13_08135 [Paracoccaceae bacterium]|nr:hypothetical protein [Paracoccaceae bacterium]
MADTGKRVEVRFGAFSCSIEGYDDPAEQMREVLLLMQQMLRETPALSDQDPGFGDDEAARIESALDQRADAREGSGPGIVVIRPGGSRDEREAEDAVTTAEIPPGTASWAATPAQGTGADGIAPVSPGTDAAEEPGGPERPLDNGTAADADGSPGAAGPEEAATGEQAGTDVTRAAESDPDASAGKRAAAVREPVEEIDAGDRADDPGELRKAEEDRTDQDGPSADAATVTEPEQGSANAEQPEADAAPPTAGNGDPERAIGDNAPSDDGIIPAGDGAHESGEPDAGSGATPGAVASPSDPGPGSASAAVNIFAAPAQPDQGARPTSNIFARPAAERPPRNRLFVPRRPAVAPASAPFTGIFVPPGAGEPSSDIKVPELPAPTADDMPAWSPSPRQESAGEPSAEPDDDEAAEDQRAGGGATQFGLGASARRRTEDADRPASPDSVSVAPQPPEPGFTAAVGAGDSEYRRRFSALLARLGGRREPEAGTPDSTAGDARASLANLAERAAARSIPDLLAVSAAWLTLVEGKPRFTRREVMEAFQRLPGDHPRTLDARIKGFGKLVRSGTLLLVDDGVFELAQAQRDRFQPMIDGG